MFNAGLIAFNFWQFFLRSLDFDLKATTKLIWRGIFWGRCECCWSSLEVRWWFVAFLFRHLQSLFTYAESSPKKLPKLLHDFTSLLFLCCAKSTRKEMENNMLSHALFPAAWSRNNRKAVSCPEAKIIIIKEKIFRWAMAGFTLALNGRSRRIWERMERRDKDRVLSCHCDDLEKLFEDASARGCIL